MVSTPSLYSILGGQTIVASSMIKNLIANLVIDSYIHTPNLDHVARITRSMRARSVLFQRWRCTILRWPISWLSLLIHIFRQKIIKGQFKFFLFTFYLRFDHLPLIHFRVLRLEHLWLGHHSWIGLTNLRDRSDQSALCVLLNRTTILVWVVGLPLKSRGLYCDLQYVLAIIILL
jgi:hypothetical protein